MILMCLQYTLKPLHTILYRSGCNNSLQIIHSAATNFIMRSLKCNSPYGWQSSSSDEIFKCKSRRLNPAFPSVLCSSSALSCCLINHQGPNLRDGKHGSNDLGLSPTTFPSHPWEGRTHRHTRSSACRSTLK